MEKDQLYGYYETYLLCLLLIAGKRLSCKEKQIEKRT